MYINEIQKRLMNIIGKKGTAIYNRAYGLALYGGAQPDEMTNSYHLALWFEGAPQKIKSMLLNLVESNKWEDLGLRICDVCGKFMTEGYILGGDFTALPPIAKRHPDVLIEISGNGEDSDDIWASRYRGEESETVSFHGLDDFKDILTPDEAEHSRQQNNDNTMYDEFKIKLIEQARKKQRLNRDLYANVSPRQMVEITANEKIRKYSLVSTPLPYLFFTIVLYVLLQELSIIKTFTPYLNCILTLLSICIFIATISLKGKLEKYYKYSTIDKTKVKKEILRQRRLEHRQAIDWYNGKEQHT